MVTAFQDDAFQSNAFQIDAIQAAAIMAGIRTFTCTPAFSIVREARTATIAIDFDGTGNFQAFNRSTRPYYKFEINLGPLDRVEAESLSAFHAWHQGDKAFFWDGFPYNMVNTYQLFGEGTGAERLFYLPNRQIGASSIGLQSLRPSTGATSNWAASSSNAWPFSLNATVGAISFANSSNTIPASGDDVRAAYACRYFCLFDPNGLRLEHIGGGLYNATLKIREAPANMTGLSELLLFSPSDISGLQLWLKADAIVGLNDGDAVTTWSDSSGNGNNATQAVAGQKPLYKTNILNGMPVVRFDGTDDELATPSIATFPSKRGTIIAVVIDNAPGTFHVITTTFPAGTVNWEFGSHSATQYGFYDGVSTATLNANDATNTWRIVSLIRSADTTIDFYINGTQKTGRTVADNQPEAAAIGIGGLLGSATENLNGDIAEILIYNTALSTANRQSIESHLSTKYAI